MSHSQRYCPPKNWLSGTGNNYFGGLTKLCFYLEENINDKIKMIEIGTWLGESTSIFAMSGIFESIDTIDPWDIPDVEFLDFVETEYSINTRHWNYINHHREYSEKCSHLFQDKSYDLVYIDGDHSKEAIERDIENYLPKIKKGGWIAGHDYGTFGTVTKTVNKKFGRPHRMFRDSSWVIQI